MWSFKTNHFVFVISHDTIGKHAKWISAWIYSVSAQQGLNSALHKQIQGKLITPLEPPDSIRFFTSCQCRLNTWKIISNHHTRVRAFLNTTFFSVNSQIGGWYRIKEPWRNTAQFKTSAGRRYTNRSIIMTFYKLCSHCVEQLNATRLECAAACDDACEKACNCARDTWRVWSAGATIIMTEWTRAVTLCPQRALKNAPSGLTEIDAASFQRWPTGRDLKRWWHIGLALAARTLQPTEPLSWKWCISTSGYIVSWAEWNCFFSVTFWFVFQT